jgi:uncharacterized protein (DUF4415 family)
MNEKATTRIVRYRAGDVPPGRTDWARVRAMTEEEINAGAMSDPDNPPLTAEELAEGEIVLPADRRKVPISVRMDPAALERFKQKGPRYQTRLNDLMVADSENRVLILDESVAAAYAPVKNRTAVMNAMLRQRAPSHRAASQWGAGTVVGGVQRARTGTKGELVIEPRDVARLVGRTGNRHHAS